VSVNDPLFALVRCAIGHAAGTARPDPSEAVHFALLLSGTRFILL
jgi:hypothetical protein